MTFRAILAGLMLGLFISAFTLFNDGVIQASWFISNHFPVSVFAIVVVLLLVINPLLRRLGVRWPLGTAEVAVIAALGLAVCGWPSFSFFWGFVPNVATPPHWLNTKAAWQAHHVMSYVPGASNELGYGHVQDWPSLAAALLAAKTEDPSIAGQVRRLLQPHELDALHATAEHDHTDARTADVLLAGLNRVIRDERLDPPSGVDLTFWPRSIAGLLDARDDRVLSGHERASVNRWLLVASFRQEILPPPDGEGVLLAGSDGATQVREMIIQGRGSSGLSIITQIPWSAWWPTIRLWGGLGLVLGIASLCLALIVHPQWSRRELLVYPLAQFVTEIGRRSPAQTLPQIAFNRLFWVGLIIAGGIHTINGLAAWFPSLGPFSVSLTFDISRLRQLMPIAGRVPGIEDLLWPYLYLSAIGFAFFLNTRVSFSVGIAGVVYVAFAAMLLARGIGVEQDYLGATRDSLMRFGAYLGFTGIIAYVGRHYYRQVALGIFGLRTPGGASSDAIWAGRGLMVCIFMATLLLRSAGLGWVLSGFFVALVLMMFLVLSRILAETGLFFVQAWWMPVAVLNAVFGAESLGPTSYIVLAMASILIVGDPRTTLMPYLVTSLQLIERARPTGPASADASPSRIGALLLATVVAGFVVAGLATFVVLHDRGIAALDGWSARILPMLPFDELAAQLADMRSRLTVAQATMNDGLGPWTQLRLEPNACGWIAVGVGLIVVCSLARLRLPWWPIHPVLFLIWGTMPASRLSVSFLLGWAIKLTVIKTGGVRGYRAVLPLMVGLIAGELLAALGWIVVGWAYYLGTGLMPMSYRVYP